MDSKVVASTARKPPNAGKGRQKGVPNKTTALLKDAILKAATDAGGGDMAEYLKEQATTNPGPFMALLGKVLPMQVDANVQADVSYKEVVFRVVKPKP